MASAFYEKMMAAKAAKAKGKGKKPAAEKSPAASPAMTSAQGASGPSMKPGCASGQDNSFLGTTSGRPGGHAGYGAEIDEGTEALEESTHHEEPFTHQEGAMDKTHSQESSKVGEK